MGLHALPSHLLVCTVFGLLECVSPQTPLATPKTAPVVEVEVSAPETTSVVEVSAPANPVAARTCSGPKGSHGWCRLFVSR